MLLDSEVASAGNIKLRIVRAVDCVAQPKESRALAAVGARVASISTQLSMLTKITQRRPDVWSRGGSGSACELGRQAASRLCVPVAEAAGALRGLDGLAAELATLRSMSI